MWHTQQSTGCSVDVGITTHRAHCCAHDATYLLTSNLQTPLLQNMRIATAAVLYTGRQLRQCHGQDASCCNSTCTIECMCTCTTYAPWQVELKELQVLMTVVTTTGPELNAHSKWQSQSSDAQVRFLRYAHCCFCTHTSPVLS
jgi:hypothetical protein